MKFAVYLGLCLVLVSVVFSSGCIEKPIGGETDEHGCLGTAGYTWCESKQKCLRTWEEECPFTLESCNSKCIEKGYDVGHCMWPSEICEDDVESGSCLVPQSRHCGNEGQCKCYCKHENPKEEMTLEEALAIAEDSECTKEGELSEQTFYNEDTGTWWIDLDLEKEGCNPACVIDVATKQAEINWRCTGLIG